MIKTLKKIRRRMMYYTKFELKFKKIHKSNKTCYICLESSLHNNMGDCALSFCRHKFLNSIGIKDEQIIEFTSPDRMRYWDYISKSIVKDDILLLRGGGFFGDLWLDGFEVILKFIEYFPENRIVLFPQSVHFSDSEEGRYWLKVAQELLSRRPNIYLFARDINSYNLFQEYFPNCFSSYTPDTVLSYKPKLNVERDEGKALICLRNDREKNIEENTGEKVKDIITKLGYQIIEQDTCIDTNLNNLKDAEKKLFDLWSTFASSGLVVTDRLHGMIFSTITSTPCLVFDNIDHKVRNEFEWIKHLDYVELIDDVSDLDVLSNRVTQSDCIDYPVEAMKSKYDSLSKLLLSFNND